MQRKATFWLRCKDYDYKYRLLQLDVLLYPCTWSFTMFCSAPLPKTKKKHPDKDSHKVTEKRQTEHFEVPNILLLKTDGNFRKRTARTVNNIRKHLNDTPLDRTTLTKMYQLKLHKSWSEAEVLDNAEATY